MFKSGAGDCLAERKNIAQIATTIANSVQIAIPLTNPGPGQRPQRPQLALLFDRGLACSERIAGSIDSCRGSESNSETSVSFSSWSMTRGSAAGVNAEVAISLETSFTFATKR